MRKIYGIIESNFSNYQAILNNAFIAHLSSSGASPKTVKNYISDLHHFLSWAWTAIDRQNVDEYKSFLLQLTGQIIKKYVDRMTEEQVAAATINRRLSSLRMFFTCCTHKGWINDQPMDHIANVKIDRTKRPGSDYLREFQTYLTNEGLSKVTRKNYVSDVRHFLLWIETVQTR